MTDYVNSNDGFIAIKDAIKLTGKTDKTIRRYKDELGDDHPDVKKEMMEGGKVKYLLRRKALVERFGTRVSEGGTQSGPNSDHIDSLKKQVANLQDQLNQANEQNKEQLALLKAEKPQNQHLQNQMLDMVPSLLSTVRRLETTLDAHEGNDTKEEKKAPKWTR